MKRYNVNLTKREIIHQTVTWCPFHYIYNFSELRKIANELYSFFLSHILLTFLLNLNDQVKPDLS